MTASSTPAPELVARQEDRTAPVTHAGDAANASKTRAGRLEFLDTVRGVAALVVALQHTSEQVWTEVLGWSHTWFRPGEWGVLAFFLCSGFIIPASLEKRGKLGEFWIGRFFRLWPLYLAALLLVVIGYLVLPGLNLAGGTNTVAVLGVNATMAQVFTEYPILIGASWTLGYELVFYLLVSGLFALKVHRNSAAMATGLFGAALVLGGTVPVFLLSRFSGTHGTIVAGMLLLVAAPVLFVKGVPTKMRIVAAVTMVPAVLMLANRPHDMYFSLILLGTMFTGTVMYRMTTGDVSPKMAWSVFLGAMAAIALLFRAYHVGYAEPITGATPQWWTEAVTFLGAYVFFGAMLLLRRHEFPRVLVYLGTISYSVYLMHGVVLILMPHIGSGITTFLLWNVVTIAGASLTYRFIEKPAIELGRRVVAIRRRRAEARAAVDESGTRVLEDSGQRR
ncbi:MAG TPA: acyltransferase [Lapillicoccus sp.]|nr:acyltransferase [Lapillicoccus sp.]